MTAIRSRAALEAALTHVAALDPRLAALWRRAGTPDLRRRAPGFAALLRIVVAQQLSFHAAAAIWRRLETRCDPPTPEAFLAQDDAGLRRLGLSRQKVRFGRALAGAFAEGRLKPAALDRLDDEAAIAALVELEGIGRWSAECYLLFSFGRPDVWPADDLALATACQGLLGLDQRPCGKEMRALGEAWRPWRSAAARLLWHGYRKQMV